MIETVKNNSRHEYVVRNLEKDEVYVFVVTAINEYGESLKKGNCKGVKVPKGKYNVTLSIIVVCERASYILDKKRASLSVQITLYYSFRIFHPF